MGRYRTSGDSRRSGYADWLTPNGYAKVSTMRGPTYRSAIGKAPAPLTGRRYTRCTPRHRARRKARRCFALPSSAPRLRKPRRRCNVRRCNAFRRLRASPRRCPPRPAHPQHPGHPGTGGTGGTRSSETVRAGPTPTYPYPSESHPESNTVRPRTTVRAAVGRGRPGVRSGRPGTPERGSVDHADRRSSAAWTTTSSGATSHTA